MAEISQDWQFRLAERDFVVGNGTDFKLMLPPGPTGTMGCSRDTASTDRETSDGVVLGRTVNTGHQISLPIELVDPGDAAGARQLSRQLTTGWRKLVVGELSLQGREPGTPDTVMTYFGKPGVITPSSGDYYFGLLKQLCTFDCSDPYAYGPLFESLGNESTFDLDADDMGDLEADTDRVNFTVTVGTGPTFSLQFGDGTGGYIFVTGVASDDVIQIDLRSGQVTRNGTPAPTIVSPSSPWFRLLGGVDNTITVLGEVSVDVNLRPAYHL